MTRLLYIESSPNKAGSTSIGVATAWLDAYRAAHPDHEIDTLDLWQLTLPEFDAEMIAAKFAVLRSQDATPAQRERWIEAQALARRFNTADKYLFSVPMWNFGIPYRLKHYIDVVTLAGENWNWSRETGYVPLLKNKKAALVYTSAGDYPPGPPYDDSDFQKPYMRRWLSFLGVDDVVELRAAPTLVPPERLAETRAQAQQQAQELALSF